MNRGRLNRDANSIQLAQQAIAELQQAVASWELAQQLGATVAARIARDEAKRHVEFAGRFGTEAIR